jgi:hypothetical protein
MLSAITRTAGASAAVVITALALAGPAGAATQAPAGSSPSPYVPTHGPVVDSGTQGIIMRDGGICDPIRHMGC